MGNIPQTYEADQSLADWVKKQRKTYKMNKLDSERIIKLNSIGFVWDAHDAAWTTRYEELKLYQSQHNNSTKVSRHYEKDRSLGQWVALQRSEYNKKTLRKDRKVLLTKIGLFNKSTTRK